MNDGLLRSARLAEDVARQQGRKRSRGAGASELAASDVSTHFVGNLITAAIVVRRRNGAAASLLLEAIALLDERLQSRESAIPLLRDQVEIPLRGFQALRI